MLYIYCLLRQRELIRILYATKHSRFPLPTTSHGNLQPMSNYSNSLKYFSLFRNSFSKLRLIPFFNFPFTLYAIVVSVCLPFILYGQCEDYWQEVKEIPGSRKRAVSFVIDGKGYVLLGDCTLGSCKELYSYDPNSNVWIELATFPGSSSGDLIGAVGFSIDNKGYVGTGYSNGGLIKEFWEYDPIQNSWSRKVDFAGVARWYAVGFSIGSKGYIGTGRTSSMQVLKDFWEYDPSNDSWNQVTDLPGPRRWRAVGFSINSKGYVGTGSDNSSGLNDFWEFDANNNQWSRKADFGGTGRYNAVGFSIENMGYIGTGNDNLKKKDFWEYHPTIDTWIKRKNFAGTERYYATGFSINGIGYLGTGDNGGYSKDFWEYKPGYSTSFTQTNISCYGECDGQITVMPLGGTSPHTFQWSNNANTTSLSNLCPDSYSLTVFDNSGCITYQEFIVTEPESLITDIEKSDVSCTGGNDGFIQLTTNGGTQPYSYLWNNGDTNYLNLTLYAGNYTVKVQDKNNCFLNNSIAIIEPDSGCINNAIISGYIFKDLNKDCFQNTDDIGFKNWWLKMEPGPKFTKTNKDGYYYFRTDTGTYKISLFKINDDNVYWASQCPKSKSFEVIINTPFDTLTNNDFAIYDSSNVLSGYVFLDKDKDCINSSADHPFENRLIKIKPGPIYASTDSNGYYQLKVPQGQYNITIIEPSHYLWDLSCMNNNGYSVNLISKGDTVINNFAIKEVEACPKLSVSIYNSRMRPCFDNTTTIQIKNIGTYTARNILVEVLFDDILIQNSSSPAWVSKNNNSYIFEIDSIQPVGITNGTYGIYFVNSIPCDPDNLLGRTECMAATVTYSNACYAVIDSTWDQSSIEITGRCLQDSLVQFIINNVGELQKGDMTDSSEYRIYVNNAFAFKDKFKLDAGDSLQIEFPALGKTLRLEADQRPGHPGFSSPQKTIEACGYNANRNLNLGHVNSVQQDDLDHAQDIYCATIRGSYDPNDKLASPAGITENHYIPHEEIIEYTIRFQNTGTDTAFNIIVLDTLSGNLDVESLIDGITSHNSSFKVFGSGILQWTFNNILLPDSNINEPASHGFATFKVKPKSDLLDGTKIQNRASMYFDFNAPVRTDSLQLIVYDTVLYNKTFFPCNNPVASFAHKKIETLVELAHLSRKYDNILWDFGDGTFSIDSNTTHIFPDTGIYNVCLIAQNWCGSDTLCEEIRLTCSKYPIADFSVKTVGFIVELYDSSKYADTHFWDFGDSQYSSLPNTVHTYSDTGTYNVCLTCNNYCSENVKCKTVIINSTGIDNPFNGKVSISIYPNPTTGIITLKLPELRTGKYDFNIINSLGQNISDPEFINLQNSKGGNQTIDISNLSNGLYIFQISTTNIFLQNRIHLLK